MAKNVREIPYTEQVERVQSLGRIADNTIPKIKGVIQDVYLREVPSRFDWSFLYASSSLITQAQYTQGTVSINTGQTSLVASSDAVFDSTFTGRQVKITSNDVVYNATFSNTTALTISPSFQGNSNASGNGYSVFQPFYTLPADFQRFPMDEGLITWNGGKKSSIIDLSQDRIQWRDSYTPTSGTPERMRIFAQDTAGNQVLELNPPPLLAKVYSYEYYRRLRPLIESTGLVLSISAGATTVLGLPGRSSFTETTTGDWLRVDELGKGQDSSWYRIIAIANDSSLTLASAFANTAITSSANFTISRAPEMPIELHQAIMYGALRSLLQDQNDPQWQAYNMRYAEALSDSKRLFVTRDMNKQMHSIAEEWQYRR